MQDPANGRSGHILIVEDNPDSRGFFRMYLGQEQFTVAAAESADEAFRAIAERRPDLIILDLNIPGTNGFDLSRRLHEAPETALIPIVVMTALTPAVESDPRIAGLPNVRRFIYKPCRPRTLLDAVRNALAMSQFQTGSGGR